MKVHKNIRLKNFSWIKIGGNCTELIETDSDDEFRMIVSRFVKEGKRFEVIGWGANTLISDRGIDSILIKNRSNHIKVHNQDIILKSQFLDLSETGLNPKHNTYKDDNITSGYEYKDINYSEPEAKDIRVYIGAGTSLPYAINTLIDQGITGLHMFSGIPGTIGASIYNNIHGGPRLLSEFIENVEFIDDKGDIQVLDNKDLKFGYDYSLFQESFGVITSANFILKLGDKDRSRAASIEWVRRKRTQPKNSLGSTFHNLDLADQERLGMPTSSTAYLIEHVLKLSGFRVGGIMIPEQTPSDQIQVNKNMLINVGDGTADDYLAVMKHVCKVAYEKCGVKLKPEIFFKGFHEEELDFLR